MSDDAPRDLPPAIVARYAEGKLGYREAKDYRFTQEAARELVTLLKVPAAHRRRLEAYAASEGRSLPTVSDFNTVFVNSPVYFAADERKNLRDNASLTYLMSFKAFGSQPFVKKWRQLSEEQAEEINERPLALLIRWPKFKRPMVFHDVPINPDLPNVCFRYRSPEPGSFWLTLQPIDLFANLLQTWDFQQIFD